MFCVGDDDAVPGVIGHLLWYSKANVALSIHIGFGAWSYLKIGWKWVSYALSRGYALISSVSLSSARDPEPAMASKKQGQLRQHRFVFEQQDAA